ncbi:hydrogenase 4 Fe-S subunit [Escherichia coli]|uniref:Hydrogenase 4 Fe-S subunit n=1 Tax=Escherichia coli TaxID=562 RepID=A0A376SAR0_ECOLX|nr:hydrogenase 4 Fe-S subunit [Escherichia coli]
MNRFVVAEPLWCTGCNTCLAACSDVHKTQGLQQHPRLALAKTSTLTAPVVCHHCEEAPCLQVCPVNAISQRDNAIQLNEKPLYWLQALRRGLPIWRNQRYRKPSGECPCAICFSG